MTEKNDDLAFSSPHKIKEHLESQTTLPKSPRKCKEVISALANKFKQHIRPTQSKAGRPKNEFTESEKEWLKNHLDKPDITYVSQGRKDQRYVGKIYGKSQYVQKRYHMWTLNYLLNIANVSSLIKNELHLNFYLVKKSNFISRTKILKAIANMYTTETFNSRPAFAKSAKMSVFLQRL